MESERNQITASIHFVVYSSAHLNTWNHVFNAWFVNGCLLVHSTCTVHKERSSADWSCNIFWLSGPKDCCKWHLHIHKLMSQSSHARMGLNTCSYWNTMCIPTQRDSFWKVMNLMFVSSFDWNKALHLVEVWLCDLTVSNIQDAPLLSWTGWAEWSWKLARAWEDVNSDRKSVDEITAENTVDCDKIRLEVSKPLWIKTVFRQSCAGHTSIQTDSSSAACNWLHSIQSVHWMPAVFYRVI